MGKTRKKKKQASSEEATSAIPHTIVMQRGKVGRFVNSLVLDLRKVMEPFTAQKLKILKNNVLRDFIHVAGPYGVTHFLLLSRSEISANLRICRLPRGPTITFRILSFSLCRDVVSSLRHAMTTPQLFTHPPLLVLNNFNTEVSSMKLMVTVLQNMFPSINVQKIKLSTIKRCVLFQYDEETNSVYFRHYAIKLLPVGTSHGVKKLLRRSVPDLSKFEDISEFITKGNLSESEGEDMTEDHVTLPQNLPGVGNIRRQQSAIKLTELGPRMALQLIKVEDGVCDGEVLHHEFITKSRKEIRETRKRHLQRRKLRERRRKEQERNVKQKQREKEDNRTRSIAGQKRKSTEAELSGAEKKRQKLGQHNKIQAVKRTTKRPTKQLTGQPTKQSTKHTKHTKQSTKHTKQLSKHTVMKTKHKRTFTRKAHRFNAP
ncbi:suppressor of SWI4 1 homolog [Dysidea avara]|uniref:suppressor of SWI4 1 homolog n=1 Tax=Dysidea avara TaxID=196820 RepID=UPI0033228765